MVFVIVVIARMIYYVNNMNRDESESIASSWQNTCLVENTKVVNEILNEYLIEKEGVENSSKSPSKKSVINTIKSIIPSLTKVCFVFSFLFSNQRRFIHNIKSMEIYQKNSISIILNINVLFKSIKEFYL